MSFGQRGLVENEASTMAEALSLDCGLDSAWVHVRGALDARILEEMGQRFNIHAMTLEDIANPGHRPKFEEFDDHLLFILKTLFYDSENRMITASQISLVVTPTHLISFQETGEEVLEPVRKRLRAGRGWIRTSGTGYLAYALTDAVVDRYFHILAEIGDDIEDLESRMLDRIESSHMEEIHGFRREMIFFHKKVWPVRELVTSMIKSDAPLMAGAGGRFIGDVYDHVIHTLDTVDSLRELLSGMLEFHMSAMGNRMNQVMRTLTIIATIFIPLTFLAGVYGMNFRVMPELDWQWGYFALLGVMAALALGMLIYFKRKKWF